MSPAQQRDANQSGGVTGTGSVDLADAKILHPKFHPEQLAIIANGDVNFVNFGANSNPNIPATPQATLPNLGLTPGESKELATGLTLTRIPDSSYTIEFKGEGTPAPEITITLSDKKQFAEQLEKINALDFTSFEASSPLTNKSFAKLLSMGATEIVISNLEKVASTKSAITLFADKVSILNSSLNDAALKIKSNDYKIINSDFPGSSVDVRARYPSKPVRGEITNSKFSANTIVSGNLGEVTICKDSSFQCSAPDADFRRAIWKNLGEAAASIAEFQKRNSGFVFRDNLASAQLMRTSEVISVEDFQKHLQKSFTNFTVPATSRALKTARKNLKPEKINELLSKEVKPLPENKNSGNGGGLDSAKVPVVDPTNGSKQDSSPKPKPDSNLVIVPDPQEVRFESEPQADVIDAKVIDAATVGTDDPLHDELNTELNSEGSGPTKRRWGQRRWGRWAAAVAATLLAGGGMWAILTGSKNQTDDVGKDDTAPNTSPLVTGGNPPEASESKKLEGEEPDSEKVAEETTITPSGTAATASPAGESTTGGATTVAKTPTTEAKSETPLVPSEMLSPDRAPDTTVTTTNAWATTPSDLSNMNGPSSASAFVGPELLKTVGVPENLPQNGNIGSSNIDRSAINFVDPKLLRTVRTPGN